MVFVCANIITVAVVDARYISPLVVGVLCDEIAGLIGYADYVVLCVANVVISICIVVYRTDTSVCIGIEVDISSVRAIEITRNLSLS